MMRKLLFILSLVLAAASCGRPKVIPDGDLTKITKDIFVSNAYANSHSIRVDSLDIYETVFKKYGYSIDDFRHTLSNFSKRKSARFSDVIDNAQAELENEYKYYKGRAAILDTIEYLAGERFARVVLQDSLIRVAKTSDTSKLKMSIPLEEGQYKITYNILVDTTDKNTNHRSQIISEDTSGRRTTVNTQWLSRGTRQKKEYTFTATPQHRELWLELGIIPKSTAPLKPGEKRPDFKRPDITIDSLTVVHYLPKKIALDSMTRTLFGFGALPDSLGLNKVINPADTLTTFSLIVK